MFDRFRKLSARHQIALVAATAAALCLVFVAVWYLVLRVPYKALFTGLRSNDAATIVADLDRKKVPYRVSDDGSAIYVPADMAERTRLAVMTEDLPLKGTVGFELFDHADMGLTDFAQKINYLRALQGELERTISSLDGVDTARVHLSLGEDRVFRDDTVAPKASVTIRMRQGWSLSTDAARGIQRLVAASVPNLDVANVVILDAKGDVVNTVVAQAASGQGEGAQAQETHAIAEYYAAKLRLALEKAYPLNTISVKVAPDLRAAQDATPDWAPANRTFPLRITVTPVLALDGAAETNIRDLAAATVGFDAGKGDLLDFAVYQAAVAGDGVVAGASWPRPLSAPAGPDVQGGDVALSAVALFVAAIATVFAFLFWLRRPRRLTESQHAEFASRLQAALNDRGGHVA